MSELRWFVGHTRPRCEKKLAKYCQREELLIKLPCYTAAHKYRGKTVQFEKPLFPGYVFLQMNQEQKRIPFKSDYIVRLLEVTDQEQFVVQFNEILLALDSFDDIRLAPAISEGVRIRIKFGPLRGIEGQVEKRYGMTTVLLRLDFIGQAAAVQMHFWDIPPARAESQFIALTRRDIIDFLSLSRTVGQLIRYISVDKSRKSDHKGVGLPIAIFGPNEKRVGLEIWVSNQVHGELGFLDAVMGSICGWRSSLGQSACVPGVGCKR